MTISISVSTVTHTALRAALLAGVVVASLQATSARAGDWVLAAGSEEGRKDALMPWGFAQLLMESTPWTTPVTGLQAPGLAPHEGSHLAAELTEPFDLSVRRARLGVRGGVPGTAQQLVVFAAVEAGMNALTRDVSVAKIGSIDLEPFVADVSFDWLMRNPDDPASSRLLQAVTVGTQVKLSKSFRLLLNAELRRQLVGEKAPPDATRIAAGLSPLLSAQLNLVF